MSSRYSHIKNLEQLRLERMRTAERLLHKEQELQRRYSSVREIFSVDGIVNYLTSSITSVTTIFNTIYKGYSFVMSLFSRSDSETPPKDSSPV